MYCPLLVSGKDMIEMRVAVHGIINVQYRTAGVSEYTLDSLKEQGTQQNFRSADFVPC
ncbi:hypothetical protein D3C78_800810 [compost metagenome]